MSKLLHKVTKAHRPHIAAKMTAENGYDETKHHTAKDLHKAGVITSSELNDLDGCFDDLVGQGDSSAKALKAVDAGRLDKGKLNDDSFLAALDAMDTDSDIGDDEPADNEKIFS